MDPRREPSPPPEDAAPATPPTARRRVAGFAAAVLAAAAAAWVAPAPWPAGAARVEVDVRGRPVMRLAVAADGPGVPVASGEGGGSEGGIRVVLPRGLPLRDPLVVEVAVEGGPAVVAADVRVTLVLPDGRAEPVPVTGRAGADGPFRAERRPPVRAGVVLALLAAVVTLWLTEAVPLFVPALAVPVALVGAGVLPAREALAPFFDPIIALFLAGYLMAAAMRRAGVDARAARALVALFGTGPRALFAGLLITSAFLSLWMSNTAAVALVLPVVLVVAAPLGDGFRRAAVLGTAYAATVGGTGSLVGTPANLLAARFLGEFAGERIDFARWFAWGVPFVVLLLPVMGVLLWRSQRVAVPEGAMEVARARAREERRRSGRLTVREGLVVAVLVAVVALWVAEPMHGVDAGVVALGGAVVLACLGLVRAGDLGSVSWEALLVFGGGIALGLVVVRSGTSDWIATRLVGLSGLGPVLSVAIVAGLTLAVSAFASNTASAAMMIPLMLPLAPVLGVDARVLVVTAAIASSVDFALVIGTPPTLMAYGTGLFTTRDIFRAGILVDLAGLLLLALVLPSLWRFLGVV